MAPRISRCGFAVCESRLSDEVQTDALTKVANRRGLEANFATECAKLERELKEFGRIIPALGIQPL